ncbi:hypothetical protein P3342_001528 [Pyrenophora teres f. teres]|nr:hypothetical protein P3342_001528 [Pyrenophora teres f. teres]
MHDNRPPRPGRQTGATEDTYHHDQTMPLSRPIASPSRQRSDESWIHLASGPSSASLFSATDEIITTGLTVQHDSNIHRRQNRRSRGSRGGGQFSIGTGHRVTTTGGNSSQEEYEESESESDRVMTSSNEAIVPSPLKSVASSDTMSEREEEDDDENATAVNYPRSTRREFQPRPNAFSRGNSQQAIRSQSGTVYTPRRGGRPVGQRQHSYPQHSPYSALAPNYHPDHDEALRASLSTLLSAAAAVRGLPKPGQPRTNPPSSARVDPASLRMVPESVALGEIAEEDASSPRSISSDPSEKPKRKASPPTASARSSSKDRRAIKKARKAGPLIEDISPTLLTWLVSAGVVVLVSAIGFSAGYVVGKETGHAEAMGQIGAAGSEAGRCGKEAAAGIKGTGLGLRKFRWGSGAGIRV